MRRAGFLRAVFYGLIGLVAVLTVVLALQFALDLNIWFTKPYTR